ncbi:MAG: tyrosine-protein phosphatase [Eubacteriales bacterium]|nr:tyrosine-protein phosphatase [Eubacteriales bacterium]
MKRILSILLSLALLVSMFAGCSSSASEDKGTNAESTTSTTAQVETKKVSDSVVIGASYPVDCEVSIHTKEQADYLSGNYKKMPSGVDGTAELSRPQETVFQWVYNGELGPDDEFVINVSENKNMSDSFTYTTNQESCIVYNLKIAQDYYWTVSIGDETSEVAHFTTEDSAPRNIYIDGITNVRDLGGRVNEDGKRINQGLIYRCGRLNDSDENGSDVIITDMGKQMMSMLLGVKSEIDIRQIDNGENGGITSSPLGNDVNFYPCPMEWEGDTYKGNKEQIIKVFSILADEDNYPVIIHCAIGTDRTGMLSFLINSLLGVDEDALFKDYMFSNFADIGGSRKITNLTKSGYYKAIKDADGDTWSEKTYNSLVDLGVSEKDLDALIDIMLDD